MNDVKTAFCGNTQGIRRVGTDTITGTAAKLQGYKLFCTPGHKGALDKFDLTEYDEDRMFPAGSVQFSEDRIARHYGVKHARMLVTGASMGIKAAIMAVGGDVVCPRFTHRSAYLGAELARVNIFDFDTDSADGLPGVPCVEQFERPIKQNPTAKALLVTSPDYFGRVADVKAIKALADKHGLKLIVDAAHGAHFATRPDIFPEGAEKYADYAVLSAHKTLRTLTQAAIGVCNDDNIARYDHILDMLGTTSPSYKLMMSVEDGVEYEKWNKANYDGLVSAAKDLRAHVKCLDNDDPLRIVADGRAYSADGEGLYYKLVERKVMPETYYGNYCVFIITLSDSVKDVNALTRALTELL